ncbi:hypothetical protein CEUSTIGMA_g11577.t1 [Chlamydomonas eustigma]|uniref:GDP-Man:Man(3)GlcNAc(2)-PP-Dol alpha-1,2-mannosyltransferase n=1 Tax=Chlamydomonas eustigma TaxID=1157962 RepID=A0A250XM51_9CHLO|nr:hypothetical protein CEUSTIGMA_g11577.t1 [Chlamydomonas eustigma]|eukprot:GAX84154.1 hypothetical protein CEUSTIGMA_g11577.t1 [Chlamydomonas eustigma]
MSLQMTQVASTVVVLLLSICIGIAAQIWTVVRKLPNLKKGYVAFFHPFADGGGGGERVLWCAVKALQEQTPHVKVAIYVREGVSSEQLVKEASHRFNISLSNDITVVPLNHTSLVLPERYPRLTLLGQAWGATKLGHEALSKFVPEVFIDTTGWAFTFPLARLAGCRVACYVHYPTVSSDMISRVASGKQTYNNQASIAGSPLKSFIKLLYYRLFALLYGVVGACSQLSDQAVRDILTSQATMVNSSWTLGHLQNLWWGHGERTSTSSTITAVNTGSRNCRIALVYPPVDTEDLKTLPLDSRSTPPYIISLAQFRPEKNHRMQLEAFALAKKRAVAGPKGQRVLEARLKLVGGCRHAEDNARLEDLKVLAHDLGVHQSVDWCVNASYTQLKGLLAGAVAGIHTMQDEHFGICVVEYMAAGVIPLAHNSGGPKADIVVPVLQHVAGSSSKAVSSGYLASTVEEYADAISQVLALEEGARIQMAAAARSHADTFSTEKFMNSFMSAIGPVLPPLEKKF